MTDPKTSWETDYRERKPWFERLAGEVQFTLTEAIKHAEIKVHSITTRVKTAESIGDKAERKDLDDPLSQVEDIVGVRVVALFLSDLPRLHQLICDSFAIHAADDKIADSDPASFGYMSVHYLATLDTNHSGPRYDDIKGIRFEIQTRTIVMDAWANVSHYLDYKGASSIPEDLRKDFFALSGLFYVADQHFEMFADRARLSQERAERELRDEGDAAVNVNLDTMQAFLVDRYPNRRRNPRASISELVEEVVQAGYEDLAKLSEALERAADQFAEYEQTNPPAVPSADGDYRFGSVGAARITLALADRRYASLTSNDIPEIEEFALWA